MRLTQCELLIGRTDLLFYGHVQKTKWREHGIHKSRALSVQDRITGFVWVSMLAIKIRLIQDVRSSARKAWKKACKKASPKNRRQSGKSAFEGAPGHYGSAVVKSKKEFLAWGFLVLRQTTSSLAAVNQSVRLKKNPAFWQITAMFRKFTVHHQHSNDQNWMNVCWMVTCHTCIVSVRSSANKCNVSQSL